MKNLWGTIIPAAAIAGVGSVLIGQHTGSVLLSFGIYMIAVSVIYTLHQCALMIVDAITPID